ncbi:MAG: SAM-dependent methyltransferase [Clostridiales bacterium]|nr:SAM-dependent methyltransferase [Clostridiales bacterium]
MGSVRLTKIVSLIPKCNTLADVGCDHGYVGIEALNTSRVDSVIFVDVSEPSLNKARQNCPQEHSKRVKYLCQDGLGSLAVDCAVIAGMGGLEIISILEEAKALPQRLVLQPMRNQKDVRQYLCDKYEIVTDVKFYDGKYYDLIYAERSDSPTKLTELELEYGKTNVANPSSDFVSYLQEELVKITNYPIYPNEPKLQARAATIHKLIAEYSAKKS